MAPSPILHPHLGSTTKHCALSFIGSTESLHIGDGDGSCGGDGDHSTINGEFSDHFDTRDGDGAGVFETLHGILTKS